MVPLTRRNLLAEKGRFAMSTVGVAFAVLLLLIVASGKVTSVEERALHVASV